MRKFEVVRSFKSIIDTITCNRCGSEFTRKEDKYFNSDKFKEFKIIWGYGSSFDNENWSWDLCEDCLLEIIKEFKIPIKRTSIFDDKDCGDLENLNEKGEY